ADEEFHPVLEVDDNAAYEAVRDDVAEKVRAFAKGFKGTWNWRLGWGKNCHTFQERMKKHLGVHHQTSKYWLRGAGIKPKTAIAMLKGGAALTAIVGEVDIVQMMAFDDDVKTYLATIMNLSASQFEAQLDKVVMAAQGRQSAE